MSDKDSNKTTPPSEASLGKGPFIARLQPPDFTPEKALLRKKRLGALIRSARDDLTQENYPSAKAHLAQALGMDPGNDDAMKLMDQVLRHSGRMFALGEQAFLGGRYGEAQKHFEEHIKLSPAPSPRADGYLKEMERILREQESTVSVLEAKPPARPGKAEEYRREPLGETPARPHPAGAGPVPEGSPPGEAASMLSSLIRRLRGSPKVFTVTCPACGLESRVSRSRPLAEQACERCESSLKRPSLPLSGNLGISIGVCSLLCVAGAFVSQAFLQDVVWGIVVAVLLGIPAGAVFCSGSEDSFRRAVLIGASGCALGSAGAVYFAGDVDPALINLIAGGLAGAFIGAVAGISPSPLLSLFFCAAGVVVGETLGGASGNSAVGAVIGALLGVGAVTDIKPSKLPLPHMILCAAAIALGKIFGQLVGDAVGSPIAGGIVGTVGGVLPVFYFFPSRRFWWHAALCVVGGSIALVITHNGMWAIFAVIAAGVVALLL